MNFPTVPTVPQAVIRTSAAPRLRVLLPHRRLFQLHHPTGRSTRNGVDRPDTGVRSATRTACLGGVISTLTVVRRSWRQRAAAQPDLHRVHQEASTNNGYQHRPQSAHVWTKHGVWRMDYEDMDAEDQGASHPCGRLLQPAQSLRPCLGTMGNRKGHGSLHAPTTVVVISDEIWSDLTLDGFTSTSPPSRSARTHEMRTVAFYAPSKTFNLAGLVGSYHIIYNPHLRDRFLAARPPSHTTTRRTCSPCTR